MLVLSSQTSRFLSHITNSNLNLTPDQYHLILRSWRLIKEGQYPSFQEQKLISDPLCLWRLIFLDTIFRIDPILMVTDQENLDYKNLGYQMIDQVKIAFNILLHLFQESWEKDGKEIASQLMLMLINCSEKSFTHNRDINYYYNITEKALIQTFERVLGEQFDQPTQAAWSNLWSLVYLTIKVSES